jgi:translocation and assembly module TamB
MRAIWFAIVFLLALPFTAAAQDDRDALTAFLEDNLSGAGRQVTVTGFSGAFSARAEMESLSIADSEGVWLTLNNVVLDWSRASLLRGVVDITELLADEVIVARKPIAEATGVPAPEATGFALPELPVSVSIKKLVAKRIQLGPSILGQSFEGSLEASANLEGGQGNAELRLLRTDAGPNASLGLKAGYANMSRELAIDLELTEDPGGIAATLLDLPGTPSVTLTIAGAGPLDDFAAKMDLRTDGAERLRGDVTLKGQEGGAQKFQLALDGDIAPLFLPDYAAFFGSAVGLKAEGLRSQSGQVDLTALRLNTRALVLDGAATIAADGLPQRFSLVGRLGLPDGTPVLLPLGGGGEARVASVDLKIGFDAAKGDGWFAAISLTGLQRDDVALAQASMTGSGRINRRAGKGGPIVGGTVKFDAQGVMPRDRAIAEALGSDFDGKLIFDWQKGGVGLRIGRLELFEAGYNIVTSARIGDVESGFRLRGSVDARYEDLSRLSSLAGRKIGGAGTLSISGQANPLGGEFDAAGRVSGSDIRVGVAEVDNLLTGASTIEFAVGRSTKGTFLRKLDINAQDLTVAVSGKLASGGSDLKGTLRFANLETLGPDYRGSLTADATFSGTPTLGRITLDGLAEGLMIGQRQADALTSGQSRLSIEIGLRGNRLEIAKAEIGNAQINAALLGYYDPIGSDLTANIALPSLTPLGVNYHGALSMQVKATGTADVGRVEFAGQGNDLALGNTEADRLLAGQSTLQAAVNFRNRRLVIESATLSNPQITADATGRITDDVRRVQLQAKLTNLALLVPDFPGVVSIAGTLSEGGDGITLDLAGTGPGGIDARVSGRLAANMRSADLAISGTAQAALADAFLGERSISGQTQFDLRLNGPLELSSLSGRATLSNGRFSAPNLPFGLQEIQSSVTLGANAAQLSMTSSPSTGGTFGVEGRIGLAAPNIADLRIGLRNIILKDPELYEVLLGGEVTVQGPLQGGAEIGGAIQVREAELRVPSSSFATIGSVPGLKHKNEPARVQATRAKAGLFDLGAASENGNAARPFRLNLVIDAPSHIFLRGRGIDAELGGRVTLSGTTENVIPSGSFDLIRGRLDILGKRLVLDEAHLRLQGGLIPHLNIIATNESDDVTTSVVITGRADEPEISFQSMPDLPQEEVLARLLFDSGLQNISALQAAQLASAVATLAGKGGEGIVGRLRKNFGLDDLDLASDAEGNLTLKAGKYISKRVYTEVEVDQQGRSKISLNLDMKNATARGSVGADGQAGIGIFVEKDY